MANLIPMELTAAIDDTLATKIDNAMKRRYKTMTKVGSTLSDNAVLYYNNYMFKVNPFVIAAGTYTVGTDILISGNYYLKLASISDTDLREVFIDLPSNSKQFYLDSYCLCRDGSNGWLSTQYAILVARKTDSASTWYLVSNRAYNSNGGSITINNAQVLYPNWMMNQYWRPFDDTLAT